MRARVALVVDHPMRDLSGLALTAFELCQHGVECYLVPMNIQERETWLIAPDFILLPHYRRNMEHYVRCLLKASIRFGVLDTEGGFYGNLKAHGDILIRDNSLLDAVRCMCVWGEAMSSFLRDEGFFSEEQLTVTGVPRYDFYCAPWDEVPKAFLPVDLQSVGQLVLLNTKVSLANPQFTTPEQDFETYTKVLGMDRAVALNHWQVGLRVVAESITLARKLAHDFSGTHFVLRPHPHERLETYAEGFNGEFSNLEARQEGAVDGWVLRASALIHRHCSTAIEAGLAGIPALSPQWVPSSHNAPDTESVSVQCQSYDELQDILRAILNRQFVTPPQIRARLDDVIRRWLYAADGASHLRVSKAILNALPERREVDTFICRTYFYNVSTMPEIWSRNNLAQWVKLAMRLPPSWSFRSFKAAPVEALAPPPGKTFTAQEVQQYTDEIQRVASRQNPKSRGVRVVPARSRGAYLGDSEGYSIAVYAE